MLAESIILFILILLSAFFSSAETALSAVNRVKIKTLADEGDKRAKTVQDITDHTGKMLSAILVGNNIVNITASALSTTIAIRVWGDMAIGFATGILTFVVLIFGEICPKKLAMRHAEAIALAYAGTIRFLMWILTPIIFLTDRFSGAVLFLFGFRKDDGERQLTETDIKSYVNVGHEEGAVETEEKEMILNVFDFSDSDAKDIMIPKIDITMIDENASYQKLMAIFRESMYSRIPVYREDTDNVIGYVSMKDVFYLSNKKEFKITENIREAYYTYEYKKTADLLVEMRQKGMSLCFVLNEYGVCVGMITLEDLLEEIVGEIRDEYDEDEKEMLRKVNDRSYLVEGRMKLDDINDALHTSFSSEDYDSVGGILIEQLEKLPSTGEEVLLSDGTVLKAKEVKNNRIEKVLLTLPPEEPAEEPQDKPNIDL